MTTTKPAAAMALAAVLIIAIGYVYTSDLQQSPPYMMHDELQFSLQARSIASSGRDLSGRWLPIFFTEPEFPPGRDPMLIYVTAGVLKVLPFSQETVKKAVALIGIANVVLMFFVGRSLFGSVWMGVLAAALLGLTPIHFIRARMVLSPFTSIPFVLAWLLALSMYLRSGSRRALLTSVGAAAVSMYTYLACVVMAPVYIAVALWIAMQREGRKVLMPIVATVAALLAPMAIWYVTHPERYSQLIEAYRLYGRGTAAVATPVLAPGTPNGPQHWFALVWQFLNPDFLFLSGDSSLVNSTRTAGLFPVAFALLILVGGWYAATSKTVEARIALLGLATAPLASLLSGAVEMNRIMFVIPFGVLMAALGARTLIQRGGIARLAAVLLLLSVPLQFMAFHRHYRVAYPQHAGKWFGGNVRGAVAEVASGSGPAYFSSRIPFATRYWAFYGPGETRELRLFSAVPDNAPSGSRAACAASDPECEAFGRSDGWRKVASVRELTGEESFLVFARQ